METAYAFLEHLGLDENADARAIRRAYARALKGIDQERDPDGFQMLRESYETALRWAAWMDEQKAQPAAVPLDAIRAVLALDAELAAQAVAGEGGAPVPGPFDTFRARMPELNARRALPRETPWIKALGEALADERLLNLDARLGFELNVAHLLVAGWRPGHEALFPAAAAVFGWNEDRRKLRRLGEAGAALDQALEERMGYGAQDNYTRTRQRHVLELLRQPEAAPEYRILTEIDVMERMVRRFPQWVWIVAPMANVESWRACFRARHGYDYEPGSQYESAPEPQPDTWIDPRWIWAVLALIYLAWRMGVFASL